MLIKVMLKDGVEGLFNADCQVACLLDAIKQKHGIARTEEIDLCSLDGDVKQLHLHLSENGAAFFRMREMCLAVLVSDVDGQPFYTPARSDYANNEQFVGILNCKTDPHSAGTRLKGRQRQLSVHRTITPVQAQSLKSKSGVKTGQKKRKLSITRVT